MRLNARWQNKYAESTGTRWIDFFRYFYKFSDFSWLENLNAPNTWIWSKSGSLVRSQLDRVASSQPDPVTIIGRLGAISRQAISTSLSTTSLIYSGKMHLIYFYRKNIEFLNHCCPWHILTWLVSAGVEPDGIWLGLSHREACVGLCQLSQSPFCLVAIDMSLAWPVQFAQYLVTKISIMHFIDNIIYIILL